MSTKFKVGDRVAVYGCVQDNPQNNMLFMRGNRASVTFISTDTEIRLQIDDWGTGIVHPKQCRKLKPKQPKRKLYALIPSYGVASVHAYFNSSAALEHASEVDLYGEVVEFVEVKKK